MIFLKLGGSLITDKTKDNSPRLDVLDRLARDIHASHLTAHSLPLIGHGSGSFGHAAAKKHGTRDGVYDEAGWRGFADVSVQALRLNRIVADAMHNAGIPVISISPASSARCEDGKLVYLDTAPIRSALQNGIVPLVMGDVAFDSVRGGTILSTEEIFAYLSREIPVTRILLAGETDGVYVSMSDKRIVPRISPANWESLRGGLGGSRGADVTGGMASKARDMLALVLANPKLTVQIFSGLIEGNVERALNGEEFGTMLVADDWMSR
jgi:isopentenyl phosphate kinase